MFTEINKLFGRDFVVGFFVPAIVLVAGTMAELHAFQIQQDWLKIESNEPLKDTTFLALVTLGVALLLMGVNRLIFRMLEGYWFFDVGSRLNQLQLWSFRKLNRRVATLRQKGTEAARQEFNRLMYKRAMHFPSQAGQVMCTAFGNSVRAFEDYPRVMYGFESINGWSRLNAALSKDFREILSNMRAGTDLWVNMWFAGLFLTAEFFALARVRPRGANYWIPAVTILVALAASRQARISAERWGEWVKAAFDVYLPKLCSQLGYERPLDPKKEREFWRTFSQAIVYRDAGSLDKLARARTNAPPVHERQQAGAAAEEADDE